MMKKIQDAGFTIVEVPGAPLPPRLRQVAVLQLPPHRPDRRRRAASCGGRWSWRRRRRRRDRAAAALAGDERDAWTTAAFYRGRPVMITGGLGFIGSNLARRLVDLGADVLLVDSLIPDYGGNLFNIDGIEDRVRVNIADVRQESTMNYLVRDRRRHLQPRRPGEPHRQHAGSVHGSRDQLPQPAVDSRGLPPQQPAASRSSSPARARCTASPTSCRSTEQHLVRPTDVNGINKVAGEYYHLVYNNVFGVRACSLRLTNIYGPRQLVKHNRQGFIGWFIRLGRRGPARSRSTATARSCATSSTSTMRPTRSCGRARPTRATARCSTSAGIEPVSHRDLVHAAARGGRHRPRALRRVAAGEEGDRHRQLLRRLEQVHAPPPAGQPPRRPARGPARGRSPSTASTCRTTSIRAARGAAGVMTTPRVPFMRLQPARGRAGRRRGHPPRDRPRLVRPRPEVEAFEREFAAACGAAHARRRRHRHRRDRAHPARRSASAPATRSSRRRCRPPTPRWRA